jgi:hypothetical protein
MLYLPMATAVRKKLKLFLDVFVDRTGRAVAGVVIVVFTSSYFPYGLRGTAAVAMVLTSVCVLACLQLRKTYVSAFRQQLIRREVDLGDVSHYVGDPAAVELLVGALDGAHERQILYSLQLLQSVRGVDFSRQLLPLLDRTDVREEPFERSRLFLRITLLMRANAGRWWDGFVLRQSIISVCTMRRATAGSNRWPRTITRHPARGALGIGISAGLSTY